MRNQSKRQMEKHILISALIRLTAPVAMAGEGRADVAVSRNGDVVPVSRYEITQVHHRMKSLMH